MRHQRNRVRIRIRTRNQIRLLGGHKFDYSLCFGRVSAHTVSSTLHNQIKSQTFPRRTQSNLSQQRSVTLSVAKKNPIPSTALFSLIYSSPPKTSECRANQRSLKGNFPGCVNMMILYKKWAMGRLGLHEEEYSRKQGLSDSDARDCGSLKTVIAQVL